MQQALGVPVAVATPGLPPLQPVGQKQPAVPPPASPGSGSVLDPALEALAGALAADRPAVNALVELVDKLLANPNDQVR